MKTKKIISENEKNQKLPNHLQEFIKQFSQKRLKVLQVIKKGKLNSSERLEIIESFWREFFYVLVTEKSFKKHPIATLRFLCKSMFNVISNDDYLMEVINDDVFTYRMDTFSFSNMDLKLLFKEYHMNVLDKEKCEIILRKWETHNITIQSKNVDRILFDEDWKGENLIQLPENFEFWFTELLPVWMHLTKDNLYYFHVTRPDNKIIAWV